MQNENKEPNWYSRREDVQALRLVDRLKVKALYLCFGKRIHKDDIQGIADAMQLELSFVVRNFFEAQK